MQWLFLHPHRLLWLTRFAYLHISIPSSEVISSLIGRGRCGDDKLPRSIKLIYSMLSNRAQDTKETSQFSHTEGQKTDKKSFHTLAVTTSEFTSGLVSNYSAKLNFRRNSVCVFLMCVIDKGRRMETGEERIFYLMDFSSTHIHT